LNFTFKQQDKIRKNREYTEIKISGNVFRTRQLVFNYRKAVRSRLGVIVTKKVGNAVVRNMVKRWIREIFRTEKHIFNTPLELIIIPRTSNLSYSEIKRDFLYFAGKYNEKVINNNN